MIELKVHAFVGIDAGKLIPESAKGEYLIRIRVGLSVE